MEKKTTDGPGPFWADMFGWTILGVALGQLSLVPATFKRLESNQYTVPWQILAYHEKEEKLFWLNCFGTGCTGFPRKQQQLVLQS